MSALRGKVGALDVSWEKAPSSRTGQGIVKVAGRDYAVRWQKDEHGVWLEFDHGVFGFDFAGEVSDEGRLRYRVTARGSAAEWPALTFIGAGEASLAQAGGAGAAKVARVRAQMPGKILRVLVGEGARVERGQSLAVMEAMKMENEIKAPQSGTIKQVKVQEGQAVETGADLLLIDPA